MPRLHTPLDPDCPGNPHNRPYDPMDEACGCMDEILASLERRHAKTCIRCQDYGAAHIEVVS